MALSTSPEITPPARRQPPWSLIIGAIAVALTGALIAGWVRQRMGMPVAPPPSPPTAGAKEFSVVVRKPGVPPAVKTGLTDADGRPVTVACTTCHTSREPYPQAKLGTELTAFHQGLKGAHGSLACVACHNSGDGYGGLRLADGRSVSFADVMQLCAQCHGPQYRDYQHGAHGGMAGHWDLAKGGRVRNNCIDCHDPHAPKYPTVRPAPGPRDRGTQQKGTGHE